MYLPISDSFSIKLLDESENYYLIGSSETVYLLSKKEQKSITEEYKIITSPGEHYGDAMGGFIDKNEQYCVSVGCGYIVYYFREPFMDYQFPGYVNDDKRQWIEKWNDPDTFRLIGEAEGLRFFYEARQTGDWECEILDADTDEWEKIRIPTPKELSNLEEQLRRSGDLKAIIAGLESKNPLTRFQAICGAVNHQMCNRAIKEGLLALQNDHSRILGYKILELATAALDKFGAIEYHGNDAIINKLIEAPAWFDRALTAEDNEAIEKKLHHPEAIVKCPRCGNELEFVDFKIACQVKCRTEACIQNSWRGI